MEYWAFLSYSHQDNLETRADGSRGHIRWAEWLHDSLETYRVPAEFRTRQTRTSEPMPERFYPVFQDEKELPINADLGEAIRAALKQSRFLIVICSPRSATSRYVNEEVRYFKELGRGDRIMTLMIDGEPNASFGNKAGFSPNEECFCPALRHPLDANNQVDTTRTDAQEPIAGDVRIKDSASTREATQKDLSAHKSVLDYMKLKLLAGLMGVGFDELAQRAKGKPMGRQFVPAPVEPSKIPKEEKTIQQVFDEDVQFSVFRPGTMSPGNWHTWLAFAYRGASPDNPDPIEEVEWQARAILGSRFETYGQGSQESSAALPRESTITIVPNVPKLEFDPRQRDFVWHEPVHREEFLARTSADSIGDTLRGKITFFLGALVIAEINVKVVVATSEESASARPMTTDRARVYRKIFASYSRRDSAVVDHVERVVTASGDRYLRDVYDIRAGEYWNDRLEELIREADIFQLFWSSNSMRSKYVRQEWEYALGLKRPNFVRPTYWEDPLPADQSQNLPPDSLNKLHFERLPAIAQEATSALHRPPDVFFSPPVPAKARAPCMSSKAQVLVAEAAPYQLKRRRGGGKVVGVTTAVAVLVMIGAGTFGLYHNATKRATLAQAAQQAAAATALAPGAEPRTLGWEPTFQIGPTPAPQAPAANIGNPPSSVASQSETEPATAPVAGAEVGNLASAAHRLDLIGGPRNQGDSSSRDPSGQPTRSFKGILKTGVVVIGGETTGITLVTQQDGVFELDLGKSQRLRKLSKKLNGKKVIVTGEYKPRSGVEIKQRRIIRVETLRAEE